MKAFINAALFLFSAFALWACGGLSGISTPIKDVPPGRDLDPPPPPNVIYIAVTGAEIPNRTRDGRSWDELGSGLPDPFAIVLANDRELFRTPVARDSLKPTWPDGPKTSYELAKGTKLKVEIWDDNAIYKKPMCSKTLRDLEDQAQTGSADLLCEGGIEIHLAIKPAEAKFGLGFSYEFRADGVFISEVMPLSPASRAGVQKNSKIVTLMDKKPEALSEGEVQSLINVNGPTGLKLTLSPPSARSSVELKEGPIYVKGN
jgi:hypothetical protein